MPTFTLNGQRTTLDLPELTEPTRLTVEMDYDDANGETLTASSYIPIHTAALRLGIRPDGWMQRDEDLRLKVAALGLDGKPLSGDVVNALSNFVKVGGLTAGVPATVRLEYRRTTGRFIPALGGIQGVQMSWAALQAPADLAQDRRVLLNADAQALLGHALLAAGDVTGAVAAYRTARPLLQASGNRIGDAGVSSSPIPG